MVNGKCKKNENLDHLWTSGLWLYWDENGEKIIDIKGNYQIVESLKVTPS